MTKFWVAMGSGTLWSCPFLTALPWSGAELKHRRDMSQGQGDKHQMCLGTSVLEVPHKRSMSLGSVMAQLANPLPASDGISYGYGF